MPLPTSLLLRAAPRALPSYAPTSSVKTRTPLNKIIYGITLVFSGYCAVNLINTYIIGYGYSEGASMFPTIPESNSISITSPMYRNGKGIKVGDFIWFRNPIMPRHRAGKRVIGLPGDYVLRDEHLSPTAGGGRVPGMHEGERREPMMVQVPEGHVWVAGDNMSRSRDSRFFGPLPLALIESKVLYNGDGLATWHSFREEQLRPAGTLSDEILKMEQAETKTVPTQVD